MASELYTELHRQTDRGRVVSAPVSADHALPPPYIFGLPEKYTEWRPDQERAISHFQGSDRRVVVQVQPTGSGKSLCYIMNALLRGGRALVLTGTKALQDQLYSDFGGMSGVEIIKGKSAYNCVALDNKYTCEWGPCNFGKKCGDVGRCEYHRAIERALEAQVVITNYSFWFANTKEERTGKFTTLVCDEAHDISSRLCDSLGLVIARKECEKLSLTYPDREEEIWDWVKESYAHLWETIKINTKHGVDLNQLLKSEWFRGVYQMAQNLGKVMGVNKNLWVLEHLGESFTMDPLWPGDFVEEVLFRGIKRILLVSATLSTKALSMLKVKPEDMDYREYPSHFPVRNRMVVHVPTCRVDSRMTKDQEGLWLNRIDQIIRGRQDRKGIVHTVSYARAQLVLHSSEFHSMMLTHNSRNTGDIIREFKKSSRPLVLVSPSVVTGYDFPYGECEYQIIGKVPFPDQRRKVDKKRKELDPEFGMVLAMQQLVQAAGRGVRAVDDHCETFVIDDHFGWFVKKYGHLAPRSFLEAVGRGGCIPQAPGRFGAGAPF